MTTNELQVEFGKHYISIRERERFWVEFIEYDCIAINHSHNYIPSYNLCRSIAKRARIIYGKECETVMVGAWYFNKDNKWGY